MKTLLTFLTLILMLAACGRDEQSTTRVSQLPAKISVTESAAICKDHKVNESFSQDGCNTCSCDARGNVMCTLMYCPSLQ